MHREFDASQLHRWEKRNLNIERVREFEFEVHCKVHENDDDDEGEKTVIWLTPEDIKAAAGMDGERLKALVDDFIGEESDRVRARTDAMERITD